MSALFDDPAVDRRFRRGQVKVLVGTMIGYTLFYFLRKNLSFAMPGLAQDYGVTKTGLGLFLTLHGIVYGLSKYVNGVVGDRSNSRKFLSLGLFLCLVVNVLFGFGPVFAAMLSGASAGETFVSTLIVVLGVLWVANGFFQSMGFAPCARLIAFWIPPNRLATMMGLWNTSHSVGAGLVTILCGYIMGLGTLGAEGAGVGMWRWCFWAPSALAAAGLVLVWFLLPDTPREEGLPDVPGTEAAAKGADAVKPDARRMIYLNPAIWVLGLCNLTINLIRFAILDWGPMLLKESKGVALGKAGWLIAAFEIAGILGMIVAGWATDRLAGGRGPRVCVFFLLGAAAFMTLFAALPAAAPTGVLVTALVGAGFCVYGPYAVTGVTATNLATKSLAGTAVGFIGIFAYASVIFSGVVMGALAERFGGWNVPFVTMIGVAFLGAGLFALLWRSRATGYDSK